MKKPLLLTLLFVSGMTAVQANANYILLASAEVAAGRNLRNSGTQFCEITVSAGSSQYTEATAILSLPKGARLLDARVKRPSSAQSQCSKSRLTGSVATFQCKLTRLMPNQKVTLITRYHQASPSRGDCSGFIKAGSHR